MRACSQAHASYSAASMINEAVGAIKITYSGFRVFLPAWKDVVPRDTRLHSLGISRHSLQESSGGRWGYPLNLERCRDDGGPGRLGPLGMRRDPC